jgi:hypothetical protein
MRSFLFTFAALILLPAMASASPAGYSLRFHGTGSGDVDRVKIPLGNPSRPVDPGGDFTLEFWLRALPGENNGVHGVYGNGDGWITGNVIPGRGLTVLFVIAGCLIAPMPDGGRFKGVFTHIRQFQGYIWPGVVAVFFVIFL